MGFTEMTHAFIAARYYVCLTEEFGEQGKAAFLHATRYYAEQRGRRMAQRAIRDGKPLTYETYCQYSEWVNSEELLSQGLGNRVEIASESPDYTMHIFSCPWHSQFQKMGLKEAGLAYCSDLDASLCRGFNPELVYEVSQTLHDHDYCIQTVRNAGLSENSDMRKKPEGIKPFEYHCGHSYWSYNEVTAAIFGARGEQVNGRVMKEFEEEYGKEMADILAGYRHTNFNVA